jgi:ATP-binding protein involved in chromosome partitioning
MPPNDAHLPTQIQQHDSRTLAISWADGGESLIDVRALRLACGCANCIDEWSGQPLLAPDSVSEDITPVGIQSVGRYAIQIEWSDGHNTGIYPFERLRGLSDQGALSGSESPPS